MSVPSSPLPPGTAEEGIPGGGVSNSNETSSHNDGASSVGSCSGTLRDNGPPGGHKFVVSDFAWGSTLGEGSFARVVHARLKRTNAHYAVKIMDKRHIRKENKVKQVLMEKTVLSRVSHEFIVKLWFTFQDAESLYMIMDLLPCGELLGVIEKHREEKAGMGRGQEACGVELSRFYLGEVVLALEYLHAEGIVHRDVKPENILVAASGHLKLTDFGTASWISVGGGGGERRPTPGMREEKSSTNNERTHSFVGTAEYVSPEVLAGEAAGVGADLWALGCLLYHAMTGHRPFHGDTDYLTFQEILQHCDGTRPLAYPEVLTGGPACLIQGLLLREPTARLGAGSAGSENGYEALKAHAFFAPLDWDGLLNLSPPYIPPPSPVLDEAMREEGGVEEDLLDSLATPMRLELMNSFSRAIDEDEESPPACPPCAWSAFLSSPGETLLLTTLVWKRSGLLSRKRQLILTSRPRLLYVDPKAMQLKGEVPWSAQLRAEARSETALDVHTPGRVYTFTLADPDSAGARAWVTQIDEAKTRWMSLSPSALCASP